MGDRAHSAFGTSYDPPTDLPRRIHEDPVTIGDLTSSARGTGARKSAGKPQWFQIPFWALGPALAYYRMTVASMDAGHVPGRIMPELEGLFGVLADWQRNYGDREESFRLIDNALGRALYVLQRRIMDSADLGRGASERAPLLPLEALVDIAAVLEFGARKYPFCEPDKALGQDGRPSPESAGNWAKGMPWSTAFSCAMSHLLKTMAGRTFDEESGRDHLAHVAVNLLFLSAYRTLYPEGDDRIAVFSGGG